MSAGLLGTIFQWLGYAVYNATPPVATSGSNVPLQSDVNGNLLVNVVGVGAGSSSTTPYYVATTASGAYVASPLALPTGNTATAMNCSASSEQAPVVAVIANGVTDQEKKTFVIDTQNAAGTGYAAVQSSSANIYSAAQNGPTQTLLFTGPVGTKVELTWQASSANPGWYGG